MKEKKGVPWWMVFLAYMAFWPLGLILTFVNIFGTGESKNARYNKGYRFGEDFLDVPYSSSDKEIGASDVGGKLIDGITSLLRRGRRYRGLGVGLAVFGMVTSLFEFTSSLLDYWGIMRSFVSASQIFLVLGVPGLALAFWGNSMINKARRYRRYSQMIGESKEVSLDRMAGAMGESYERVCSDLEKMIGNGYFEGYYLDNERRVITTAKLKNDFNSRMGYGPNPGGPENEPVKAAPHPADVIRSINGGILHPEVSRKVMQLENLTRRIYSYTAANPEKERFARSFKERYLPKTISILESYARFEQSGSSGENVRAAMQEVESVLDVLVKSFEKQLDMLYMDEALNVTTDIDVLENMMSGDGLGESPFSAILQQQAQGEGEE